MRGCGSAEMIKLLAAHGARLDASTNVGGETALHWACEGSDIVAVRELLKSGADPNARDTRGRTPLARAAEGNQLQSAEALLVAGADPNVTDGNGSTPLMACTAYKGSELAQLLLEHGANPAARTRDGKAAWDIAVANGAIDVLRVLGGPPGKADARR